MATQTKKSKGLDAPAEDRAGVARATATQGGFVDQMSRRSGEDALEGHFVVVDKSATGVSAAYKDAGLEHHQGFYGVYLEPTDVDSETGIPTRALVRLRDETNARIVLPYDALSPAVPGSR